VEAGSKILLWDSETEERKRRYTWRAISVEGVWIGTDTHLANELVYLALMRAMLPAFAGFRVTQREPRGVKGGRLDFKLEAEKRQCFVEVKSATVVDGKAARFPDSISPRATGHLKELTKLAKSGHRAVLIFLIQRGDIERMEINRGGDPLFARAVKSAAKAGVEFLAIKHSVTPKGFGRPVEVPVVK
jgi:sugar fermentation stimulation protein A